MELRVPHMLDLFNIVRENDGKENCAKVLEEEFKKMFGIKSLNDEHDCSVAIMNSGSYIVINDALVILVFIYTRCASESIQGLGR